LALENAGEKLIAINNFMAEKLKILLQMVESSLDNFGISDEVLH